jgi:hypothetical protein
MAGRFCANPASVGYHRRQPSEQIEDNTSVDIELTDELLLGINQILLKVSSFKPRS